MNMPAKKLSPEAEAEYMAAVQRLWRAAPIEVELQAPLALLIVAELQLALRHPSQTPKLTGMVEAFTRSLIRRLGDIEPGVLPVLDLGWDRDYDQPAPER